MLAGKKIGFVLTVGQLGKTAILREIKKMMFAGAETFIVLLDLAEKKETIAKRLQSIFAPSLPDTNRPAFLSRRPLPDLLVLAPDSEILWGCLEQITGGGTPPFPLVLITAPGNMPAQPLNSVSSLMKRNGIYFVPFGPIEQRQQEKEKRSVLHSRLDLIAETCAAALEGHQLKPSTWEDLSFPH